MTRVQNAKKEDAAAGMPTKHMLLFIALFLASSLAMTWWRTATVTAEDFVAALFVGAFAAVFYGGMTRAGRR